jgi:hypothetical protein
MKDIAKGIEFSESPYPLADVGSYILQHVDENDSLKLMALNVSHD